MSQYGTVTYPRVSQRIATPLRQRRPEGMSHRECIDGVALVRHEAQCGRGEQESTEVPQDVRLAARAAHAVTISPKRLSRWFGRGPMFGSGRDLDVPDRTARREAQLIGGRGLRGAGRRLSAIMLMFGRRLQP